MTQGVLTRIRHQGKRATFRTLAAMWGVPYKVLWRRYRDGDRGQRLIRPVEVKYGHRGRWNDEAQATNSHTTTAPAGSRMSIITTTAHP